jgi:hypothetical protein
MASTDSRWSIAIYSGASPLALAPHASAANPVLTAQDVTDIDACFVADPFMHHDGTRWSMFVEVLNRPRAMGEIGLATSDDGIAWTYDRIVLAEPFHLSYPFVFEHRGEHFLLPETFEAAQVRLYRATRFPYEWTLDTVLLDGEVIVDASLLFHDRRWWMFGCGMPKGHDLLRLWVADDVRGPWREHPRSPIVAGDKRIGRPAGRPVVSGDRLYRFAQDCASEYGTSVRAIEITRLTPTEYAEREAAPEPVVIGGTHAWNARRAHHLDAHRHNGGWIACVDGDRFAEINPE